MSVSLLTGKTPSSDLRHRDGALWALKGFFPANISLNDYAETEDIAGSSTIRAELFRRHVGDRADDQPRVLRRLIVGASLSTLIARSCLQRPIVQNLHQAARVSLCLRLMSR